jgi:hypothetical protein
LAAGSRRGRILPGSGYGATQARWSCCLGGSDEDALKPPEKSGKPTGVIPPNWHLKRTLQLLRREAEEQIKGPETKPRK